MINKIVNIPESINPNLNIFPIYVTYILVKKNKAK